MSEKRFICGLGFPINSDDPIRIISDSVEDKDYYKFSDICNVLNEQQATISRLEEENEQLKQEKDKYRVMINANASLNDEVYEQLKKTEKSYKECREENEQLKEQLQMIKEIIQTQITETKEYLQTSIRGGMPTGSLYSEIELLQKLKKECFDE